MPVTTVSHGGRINGKIHAHESANNAIPKRLILLDGTLRILERQWVTGENFHFDELAEGNYVIRLVLNSGATREEVVTLKGQEEIQVIFDLGGVSPRETQEWAYMLRANPVPLVKEEAFLYSERRLIVDINLVSYIEGRTEFDRSFSRHDLKINEDGESFTVQTRDGLLQYLEITAQRMAPKIICLPPDHQVKVLIRLAEANEQAHPLEVTVATNNWEAETLLAMMSMGALKDARALLDTEQAEQLLLHKRKDPPSAAIGGYYILKAGDLDRLHNWANNLAEWYPWLPDGAIIHAWQLIKTYQGNPTESWQIKSRLMQAWKRGIPVYTEGLRLLYEGMLQLSSHYYHRDAELEKVLGEVRIAISLVDWGQGVTTLNLPRPDYENKPTPLLEDVVSDREVWQQNEQRQRAQAG